MSLSGIAQQTLQIIEQGSYLAPSGATVQLGDLAAAARAGTRTYTPDELQKLIADAPSSNNPPRVD